MIDQNTLDETNLNDQLTSLVSSWSGACDVILRLDPEALNALALDYVATTCVIEITREGIANAVKHSGASECEVEILYAGPSSVGVRVVSTGKLRQADAGFGLNLIGELSNSWSLAQVGESVSLETLIALHTP